MSETWTETAPCTTARLVSVNGQEVDAPPVHVCAGDRIFLLADPETGTYRIEARPSVPPPTLTRTQAVLILAVHAFYSLRMRLHRFRCAGC